jgi:hypothetical protein
MRPKLLVDQIGIVSHLLPIESQVHGHAFRSWFIPLFASFVELRLSPWAAELQCAHPEDYTEWV